MCSPPLAVKMAFLL